MLIYFPISNKSYIFAESNLKIIKDMKVESKEKNGSKNIYYKSLYEYKKFYEKLLLFVIIAIQKHERAKRLEGGTLYLIFPKVDSYLTFNQGIDTVYSVSYSENTKEITTISMNNYKKVFSSYKNSSVDGLMEILHIL